MIYLSRNSFYSIIRIDEIKGKLHSKELKTSLTQLKIIQNVKKLI